MSLSRVQVAGDMGIRHNNNNNFTLYLILYAGTILLLYEFRKSVYTHWVPYYIIFYVYCVIRAMCILNFIFYARAG